MSMSKGSFLKQIEELEDDEVQVEKNDNNIIKDALKEAEEFKKKIGNVKLKPIKVKTAEKKQEKINDELKLPNISDTARMPEQVKRVNYKKQSTIVKDIEKFEKRYDKYVGKLNKEEEMEKFVKEQQRKDANKMFEKQLLKLDRMADNIDKFNKNKNTLYSKTFKELNNNKAFQNLIETRHNSKGSSKTF